MRAGGNAAMFCRVAPTEASRRAIGNTRSWARADPPCDDSAITRNLTPKVNLERPGREELHPASSKVASTLRNGRRAPPGYRSECRLCVHLRLPAVFNDVSVGTERTQVSGVGRCEFQPVPPSGRRRRGGASNSPGMPLDRDL